MRQTEGAGGPWKDMVAKPRTFSEGIPTELVDRTTGTVHEACHRRDRDANIATEI